MISSYESPGAFRALRRSQVRRLTLTVVVVSSLIVHLHVYMSNKSTGSIIDIVYLCAFSACKSIPDTSQDYICIGLYFHYMAQDDTTTVRVSPETWKRLNQRKGPGDSFDDIISQLLDEAEGKPSPAAIAAN